MLTQERANELFEYREDGNLYWKVNRLKKRIGDVVGIETTNGYLRYVIDGKGYALHRVVWLMHYGVFPKDDLDHIDRNRKNNRIGNLREASRVQNNGNSSVPKHNTSGYKGVQWCATSNKWRVCIYKQNKKYWLGRYKTIEEAAKVYHEAAIEYFGEFAKTSFV